MCWEGSDVVREQSDVFSKGRGIETSARVLEISVAGGLEGMCVFERTMTRYLDRTIFRQLVWKSRLVVDSRKSSDSAQESSGLQ